MKRARTFGPPAEDAGGPPGPVMEQPAIISPLPANDTDHRRAMLALIDDLAVAAAELYAQGKLDERTADSHPEPPNDWE
jgi:hypothetical protein